MIETLALPQGHSGYPSDKWPFGLGVGFPIEAIFLRKAALQILILRGNLRMGTQVVAKGDRFIPLTTLEGNEVKVMGS